MFREAVARLKHLVSGERVGFIRADPNPIQLSQHSGLGVTTLMWTSKGTETVEVHVGAPDGPLFHRSGPSGNATTGEWVRDGMAFYLQDVSGGSPLTAANTLAVVQVHDDSLAVRAFRRLAPRLLPTAVRSWLWEKWRGDRSSPPVGWVRFGGLRRVRPVSRQYGSDRGRAIDRYYIETFLARNRHDIQGRVLEVEDDSYTREFGGYRVIQSDVLHVVEGNPKATIVADLTHAPQIPSDAFDCIIFTQTLQFIYDVRAGVETLYRILKPGGVLLATFSGISQTYDSTWGDSWYWHLTNLSACRLFGEVFGQGNAYVQTYGNVLAAISFLEGLAAEELRQEELDYRDPGYEITIAVRAVKPGPSNKSQREA